MESIGKDQLRIEPYSYRRRGKRTRVKGHMRPDKGKKGRTPPSQKWFKAEGKIAYKGKEWSKDTPESERRAILRGMVKAGGEEGGYSTTVKKLIALSNVTTDRETRRIARDDARYLRREFRE